VLQFSEVVSRFVYYKACMYGLERITEAFSVFMKAEVSFALNSKYCHFLIQRIQYVLEILRH